VRYQRFSISIDTHRIDRMIRTPMRITAGVKYQTGTT